MHILTNSINDWISSISANSIIVMIMMIFMLVGAADRILGNRWGYGEEFEKGFSIMGTLALSIAALIAIVPLFSSLIRNFATTVMSFVGADPSAIGGLLLGADMGGYALSKSLETTAAIGDFNGLIPSSLIGPTIAFYIPVAMSIICRKDHPYMAMGILVGLITVPAGCITGGLAMKFSGYDIPLKDILLNTIPPTIVALIIVICLWFIPKKTIKVFSKIGNAIIVLTTIITALAVFQLSTGILIPGFCSMVLPDETTGLSSFENGLLVCCRVGIMLTGAFPMVKWIKTVFEKPLEKAGNLIGIDKIATAGLVANIANYIPMLEMVEHMNPKGKLLSFVFTIGGSAMLGDFLGFTASVNPQMITPVIIAKITGAVTALILACLASPILLKKIQNTTNITE